MGKMIEVEGFKAFRGVMRVTSFAGFITHENVWGEWLYKPDTHCWYCNGKSYPVECCKVLEVE